MVGMPYPNIKSPVLKEKMDYLNANFVSLPSNPLPFRLPSMPCAPVARRTFYEELAQRGIALLKKYVLLLFIV